MKFLDSEHQCEPRSPERLLRSSRTGERPVVALSDELIGIEKA
jgi:hypothetical protein